MPKVDRNYSWTQIWDNMYRGSVKGMFAFGMNGVAIGPDSQKNIDALKKADLLVVGEIYPDETSEFWKSPGITPEEMKTINTTVYRLPCAGFRRERRVDDQLGALAAMEERRRSSAGRCRLDQDIVAQIFLKVRELYQKEGGKFPDPILNLTWPYVDAQHPALGGFGEGDERQGAGRSYRSQDPGDHQEGSAIAGLRLAERRRHNFLRQLDLLRELDRGREPTGASRHRRSVRPGHLPELGMVVAGESPRALQPRVLRSVGKAVGCDPQAGLVERGCATLGGQRCARLQTRFAPQGPHGPVHHDRRRRRPDLCAFGRVRRWPFPEHYEPIESPVQNALHPNQSNNPVVKKLKTPADKYATPGDGFNMICTTYRLTEHYHYWTKNNQMNVQLIPEPFVEIPVELAAELGIKGNDKVKVTSARSYYMAKAFVTKRIKPMTIDGKKIYQIGIPIHQGYRGIQEDEGRDARTILNRLTPTVDRSQRIHAGIQGLSGEAGKGIG